MSCLIAAQRGAAEPLSRRQQASLVVAARQCAYSLPGRVMMNTRPIRVGTTQEQQVLQARERKPNLPLQIALTTDFAFVRYIGHPRMEINEHFLAEWAQTLG
jgi:hypothetical protein